MAALCRPLVATSIAMPANMTAAMMPVMLSALVNALCAPLHYRLLLHTRLPSAEQVDDIVDLAFNGRKPSNVRA